MIIMFQVRLIQIEFNTIYENIWFLKLYLTTRFLNICFSQNLNIINSIYII